MISLMFRILADAAPWRKTVTQDLPKDAKKAGSDAGKEFGNQMKSVVMSYIGGGAILGALKDQANKAVEILREAASANLGVQEFQELKAASDATGMSMAEIQKIARDLPVEFEAMMKSIRDRGGFFNQEDLESLKEVKTSMDEASSAAGKLFATIWRGSKGAAMAVANTALESGGAVAQLAGHILGNKDLESTGMLMTETGRVGMENPAQSQAPIPSAALAFSRAATQQKQFNDWWESVGGPEASRSGGSDATAAEIRSLHSTIRDRL